MNKEVHYEGWLIKSPPTKRIWRARWRRRWFTLKQGEIPEQFCLEYYTDRNCRKLKGIIDLDQCEQVDCGLRLENRKQKFQFMFDIKTPKRTYYLAADTEADMRDWVNCICQVCHLHDTKQSNELLQDSNRIQHAIASNTPLTRSISNVATATTAFSTFNSSSVASCCSSVGVLSAPFGSDIQLRRPVVLEQPQSHANFAATNVDCAYVNTEYSNRETLLCDMRFDQQQLAAAATASAVNTTLSPVVPSSPGAAIYLNSPLFGAKQQQQQQQQDAASRLAINSNGVVRKLPENLVLSSVPFSEIQQQQQHLVHSQLQAQQQQQLQEQQQQQQCVQPSPALSTASGPYIPISECFSGSPKFTIDGNNPTTPLNNLDPKFYDTPRSHNNIGLNLTTDQSYSPKITNCSLQQLSSSSSAKNRSHRSDSDSESVFTDDEEWTHPLPLRENVDRSTRPSDSSVENESFVLTYSQRFSKIPDEQQQQQQQQQHHQPPNKMVTKSLPSNALTTSTPATMTTLTLEKMDKMLKNKNNLIIDFKEHEKIPRDLPEFSDTENTSPAIGPRDATSVVDESYDIPRSHNLPYYNMGQLFEKQLTSNSPETNPIAASTPNLFANNSVEAPPSTAAEDSPAQYMRTLPRPHCYTNAAPTKFEGNVFRYDFIEQGDLPPVNRKLKPKVNLEDKPPEEVPAKPPGGASTATAQAIYDNLASKLLSSANIQSPSTSMSHNVNSSECLPLRPPSVDRKLKPHAYKLGNSATIATTPLSRRSTGCPLSMVLPNDGETYVMETRTLPRSHFSADAAAIESPQLGSSMSVKSPNGVYSIAPSMKHLLAQKTLLQSLQTPPKNEHKLQYFDLDVANPPQINRQSMSVGNLYTSGGGSGGGNNRLALAADPSARAPAKSGVVYNFVDFVKTEAFKRIREERKKESEGGSGSATSGNVSGSGNASGGNGNANGCNINNNNNK